MKTKPNFKLMALFLGLTITSGISAQITTVFDIIQGSPDHTILETALLQEGLDVALNDTSADYTVFAPTDSVFNAFWQAKALQQQICWQTLP